MSQRIRCRTFFDITVTEVKNHFNRARLPFQDAAGQWVKDEASWHRSRNKQRNWETLAAVISLRTLPTEITKPELAVVDGCPQWSFNFTVDQPGALEIDQDPVGALKQDCQDVPMHLGLDEGDITQPCMISLGSDANTFFDVLSR
jgi:hypothetical protein